MWTWNAPGNGIRDADSFVVARGGEQPGVAGLQQTAQRRQILKFCIPYLDSGLRTEYKRRNTKDSPEMRKGRDPLVGLRPGQPREVRLSPLLAAAAGLGWGHDWADLSLPGRFQKPARHLSLCRVRRRPGSDFGFRV